MCPCLIWLLTASHGGVWHENWVNVSAFGFGGWDYGSIDNDIIFFFADYVIDNDMRLL